MRWLLGRPGVACLLVGASRVSQVERNVRTVAGGGQTRKAWASGRDAQKGDKEGGGGGGDGEAGEKRGMPAAADGVDDSLTRATTALMLKLGKDPDQWATTSRYA